MEKKVTVNLLRARVHAQFRRVQEKGTHEAALNLRKQIRIHWEPNETGLSAAWSE